MRLPIIYIPKTKFKKFLHIEKCYSSEYMIVPIGCDCHPAYVLSSLYLRTQSLPFDWLNIEPIKTFEYVNKNIDNNFQLFLKNLKRNENGYFISDNYPYAEFMHEDKLNHTNSLNKFERRIKRFVNHIKNEKVVFIHNIPANSIKDKNDIYQYITDIKLFISKVPPNSKLCIYIRYDEELSENKSLSDELFNELIGLNIKTYKYIRKLKDYGIWGEKANYFNLLTTLGIELKIRFPKVFIK